MSKADEVETNDDKPSKTREPTTLLKASLESKGDKSTDKEKSNPKRLEGSNEGSNTKALDKNKQSSLSEDDSANVKIVDESGINKPTINTEDRPTTSETDQESSKNTSPTKPHPVKVSLKSANIKEEKEQQKEEPKSSGEQKASASDNTEPSINKPELTNAEKTVPSSEKDTEQDEAVEKNNDESSESTSNAKAKSDEKNLKGKDEAISSENDKTDKNSKTPVKTTDNENKDRAMSTEPGPNKPSNVNEAFSNAPENSDGDTEDKKPPKETKSDLLEKTQEEKNNNRPREDRKPSRETKSESLENTQEEENVKKPSSINGGVAISSKKESEQVKAENPSKEAESHDEKGQNDQPDNHNTQSVSQEKVKTQKSEKHLMNETVSQEEDNRPKDTENTSKYDGNKPSTVSQENKEPPSSPEKSPKDKEEIIKTVGQESPKTSPKEKNEQHITQSQKDNEDMTQAVSKVSPDTSTIDKGEQHVSQKTSKEDEDIGKTAAQGNEKSPELKKSQENEKPSELKKSQEKEKEQTSAQKLSNDDEDIGTPVPHDTDNKAADSQNTSSVERHKTDDNAVLDVKPESKKASSTTEANGDVASSVKPDSKKASSSTETNNDVASSVKPDSKKASSTKETNDDVASSVKTDSKKASSSTGDESAKPGEEDVVHSNGTHINEESKNEMQMKNVSKSNDTEERVSSNVTTKEESDTGRNLTNKLGTRPLSELKDPSEDHKQTLKEILTANTTQTDSKSDQKPGTEDKSPQKTIKEIMEDKSPRKISKGSTEHKPPQKTSKGNTEDKMDMLETLEEATGSTRPFNPNEGELKLTEPDEAKSTSGNETGGADESKGQSNATLDTSTNYYFVGTYNQCKNRCANGVCDIVPPPYIIWMLTHSNDTKLGDMASICVSRRIYDIGSVCTEIGDHETVRNILSMRKFIAQPEHAYVMDQPGHAHLIQIISMYGGFFLDYNDRSKGTYLTKHIEEFVKLIDQSSTYLTELTRNYCKQQLRSIASDISSLVDVTRDKERRKVYKELYVLLKHRLQGLGLGLDEYGERWFDSLQCQIENQDVLFRPSPLNNQLSEAPAKKQKVGDIIVFFKGIS